MRSAPLFGPSEMTVKEDRMSTNEIVSAYCAAWNEKEDGARAQLLAKSWSEGGVYEDPNGVVAGRSNLNHHIVGFHQAYAGCRIVATSAVDQHSNKIHFTWQLQTPDGGVAIDGRDFGELDSDGRISHIVGFFGPPPGL